MQKVTTRQARTCTVEGCDKPHRSLGYCGVHYDRVRKHGTTDLPPKRACTVEGCDRKHAAHGLCALHLARQTKGYPLDLESVRWVATYRDELGRKKCSMCSEWKPEADYSRSTRGKDGFLPHCRICSRNHHRMTKYGVTAQRMAEILAEQGGRCAICKTDKPAGQGWMIDHDHACCNSVKTCGKCVRGILCSHCNAMLGMARDSQATLQAAIKYLAQ